MASEFETLTAIGGSRNPVQETRFQELNKTQGSSGVGSAQEFTEKQFAGEQASLDKLALQMKSQAKPLDVFTDLETKAGLPELRTSAGTISKEIASLEDALDVVEPSVAGRSRNSLLTEAQRQRTVQVEKEPLQEKLTKLGTSLGRISSSITAGLQDISTKTGLVLQGQDRELEPARLQYTALVDRNARLSSAFTSDRQVQLDDIARKFARDNQLNDREWELAATLGASEENYLRDLRGAAASEGVQLTGNESENELLALISKSAAADKAASNTGFDFTFGDGTPPTGDYSVEPVDTGSSTWDEVFGGGAG